ncbi:hypothetical protein [Anaeromassilibacillus senegalensis]|uniref:hypothetical protein n=1 Tax=Anaeromassilibacillus senegalensis TaxID=1673717 RepID=UPI00068197CE|nr:hypothetical protein [Anaeromassilibacillus senegalensis]
MKKAIAALMALALCTGASATAFAAEEFSTELTFTLRNEPTYTVTIPTKVAMEKEGTEVEVVAEDVKDLNEGERISVTIAGTDYYRNQMVMVDPETRGTMRYQIITPDDRVLETTGDKDQMNGQEIVSFTESGSATYTIKPVVAFNVKPGNYSGVITYGIEVVE